MRFSGQGLMSHTSATAITRFFEKSRGKALSTIWFGLSSAEFILPVLVTYLFIFLFLEDSMAWHSNTGYIIFTFSNF